MKQNQMKKFAAALTAALVLTTSTAGTAFAAEVPAGTATSVAQSVSASLGNVTDGTFSFTLEEAMTLGDQIAFVYSVEGVTEVAKAEVMKEEFDYQYTVKLPADSGIKYDYSKFGEMKDLRTQTKRFFYGFVKIEENSKGLPISIGLNAMTNDKSYKSIPVNDEGTVFMKVKNVASGRDELYIPLPMDRQGKELALTLPAVSGSDVVVALSPLEIFVEKESVVGVQDVFYLDISFRMEDGSLKKIDECYTIDNVGGSNSTTRVHYNGMARSLQDLTKVKNIIIDGREYDIPK